MFIGHRTKALTRPSQGRWLSLWLILAGVVGPTPATAGPPYATDDPEPADFHSWEVYLASQYANGAGVVNGALSGLDVNFGAARNTQVTVGMPLAYSRTSGNDGRSGMGDLQSRRQVSISRGIGHPSGGRGLPIRFITDR